MPGRVAGRVESGVGAQAPAMDPGRVIRAAGGVVWRVAPDGDGIEILLIHRGRYDDWSLPKGKAEPGEEPLDTARREVAEETGLNPVIGPELSPVSYRDHRGREKTVRYWAMSVPVDEAEFVPNDEVDEVRWCAPAIARDVVSYLHDAAVIDELEAAVIGG